MKCPIDNETLVMADRSGVEIDYCPKCRGVWLDRGELDKIIEKSVPASNVPRGRDMSNLRQDVSKLGKETSCQQRYPTRAGRTVN